MDLALCRSQGSPIIFFGKVEKVLVFINEIYYSITQRGTEQDLLNNKHTNRATARETAYEIFERYPDREKAS